MNVYDIVTQRILEKLKSGVVPWTKTWVDDPVSGISGKPYNGVNLLLLDKPGEYFTFKEMARLRGTLKDDYTTYIIVYYSPVESKRKVRGNEEDKKSFVLKYYKVYHISDIEGIPPKVRMKENLEAEKVIEGYGEVPVRHDYKGAFYSPSEDFVNVPDMTVFQSEEHYYVALFHELIHSTGHKKRLDRFSKESVQFGSEVYSKEELVAELGACMLAGKVGIENVFDTNASYIQAWISRLENDHRLIVSAGSKARKAVEYILKTPSEEPMMATATAL